MRRQRPLDVNLWLRKSPPSCEQRYDLKAACLPVNVCLLRSSINDPSRAVGSARHKRCSWPIGARQEQWRTPKSRRVVETTYLGLASSFFAQSRFDGVAFGSRATWGQASSISS